MTTDPPARTSGPLWEAASLPSGVAIAAATRTAAVVLVVGSLVGFVGGWQWALSIAAGGGVVLGVLWASARLLISGSRRAAPGVALALALAIYLVAIVGLVLLAVAARPGPDDHGWLRGPGVAGATLGVLAAWTVTLVVLHVRHDRPRGRPPVA